MKHPTSLPSKIEAQIPTSQGLTRVDRHGDTFVVERVDHTVYGDPNPWRTIYLTGTTLRSAMSTLAILDPGDPDWSTWPAPVWFDAIADEMLAASLAVAS